MGFYILSIGDRYGFKEGMDLERFDTGDSLESVKSKRLLPRRRGILPRHDYEHLKPSTPLQIPVT